MRDEADENRSATQPSSKIINLNVGGTVFATSRETLAAAGDSFFSSLISEQFKQQRDQNNNLFIDRDRESARLARSAHLILHTIYALFPETTAAVPRAVALQRVLADFFSSQQNSLPACSTFCAASARTFQLTNAIVPSSSRCSPRPSFMR